jgi:hypothetical protein
LAFDGLRQALDFDFEIPGRPVPHAPPGLRSENQEREARRSKGDQKSEISS